MQFGTPLFLGVLLAVTPASAAIASTEDPEIRFADEIELLDAALDALEAGDTASFDALAQLAQSSSVLPPYVAAGFTDRDTEVLLNTIEILRSDDVDLVSWVVDAIGWESDALADYSAAPGPITRADLVEDDAASAALLFHLGFRDIKLGDATTQVLELLDLDAVPDLALYEAALAETKAMADNGVTDIADVPDPETTSTATTAESASSGTAVWLALALISISAIVLGLFALRRTREANNMTGLANTDGLTGLHNRRKFDADVDQQSTHTSAPVAMLMVDVDHFKVFNDTHGHDVGDDVLKLVGTAISGAVRANDIAYRYGGEEFSVLLPDTEATDALVIAERVRQAISRIELETNDGLASVTASVGVASGPSEDLPDLIRDADQALYVAKREGRNQVALR